jgi:hypothetical protein
MGWKKAFFGNEHPTRNRIVGWCLVYAGLALMFTGLSVNFVPSPLFRDGRIAIAFGFVGVVLTALILAYGLSSGNMQRHWASKGWGTWGVGFRMLLFVLLMPPVLGFMCYAAAGKALPWAWTRIFGVPYEVRTVMHTEHRYGRRSCRYRLKGGPLEHSFPDYVCISTDAYNAHPDQDVEVLLQGRQSALGFSVIHVRGKK